MKLAERLLEMKSALDNCNTEYQFNWNKKIFDRLIDYIKQSNNDEKKFKQSIWNDFEVWCAYYITTEDNLVFFPTEDQSKMFDLIRGYDEVWALLQRRGGKSHIVAAISLYLALRQPNKQPEHVLITAPTTAQLVVMDDVRTFLTKPSAKELFDIFIGEDVNKTSSKTGDDKLGTTFNKEYIRFKNGSDIEAINLNVKQEASSKRGFSATVLIIDESSLVKDEIFNKVISPIIMDSFSKKTKKKLIRIGTPDLSFDQNLAVKWERAQASQDVGTLHSHCWNAVRQGIRSPTKMKRRFEELGIHCPWVSESGVCPTYAPDVYTTVTGKAAPVQDKCPCGSQSNDAYVQEDLALFPQHSSMGIPADWVEQAGKPYPLMVPELLQQKGKSFGMSIDYGDVTADTQICIWEETQESATGLATDSLKMVYQEVVNDLKVLGVRNPSVDRIKYLYRIVQPRWITIDCTGKREVINELVRGDGAIPSGIFITNKTAENNGVVGTWFSGVNKSEHMNVLREILRQGKIVVSRQDKTFWEKFSTQLKGLRPEPPTPSRPYVVWGNTMHVTDAVMLAAYALHLKGSKLPGFSIPVFTRIDFL